jgi:hypothetical protein
MRVSHALTSTNLSFSSGFRSACGAKSLIPDLTVRCRYQTITPESKDFRRLRDR